MDVRPAEPADREQIRAIARDSFQSSYSLSPQQIETTLEQEFDDSALSDLLDDPQVTVLVVEDTMEGTKAVYGFITVEHGSKATIRWLHVDPEARGDGMATALLERVREEFAGTPIAAIVLDDAVEGGEFLKGFGLKESEHDELTVGGEEFDVTVFAEGESTELTNEPAVTVPETVRADGDDRLVEHEERIPGRDAPFFTVYAAEFEEEDTEEQDAYGYFCSQCGSTDVSADGQDRLECGNCGNTHLADEWDDAYL